MDTPLHLKRSLPWLFVALGLTQAAHSIEEVLTGLWNWMPVVSGAVHQRLGFIPILSMRADVFAAGNLIIVAALLGFSPLPFLRRGWTWKVVTAVAVVELLNGLNHIVEALLRHGYFSGSISGAVMIVVSLLILLPRLGSLKRVNLSTPLEAE